MRMSEREYVPVAAAYSVASYREDVAATIQLPPGQRGAMVAAAKKRLKAGIVMQWVLKVAVEHDLDMTPTLAQNLVKAWVGRCVARAALASRFGMPGRTAAAKSPDVAQLAVLAEKYREEVLNHVATTLASLKHAA